MSRLSRALLPLRFAARELRGGVSGFRIFLACLALGVAAVAAVGSVRMAINEGLIAQGAVILGGDAQVTTTYRRASESERAWMEARADAVSEVVDFRSMAVGGPEDAPPRRVLTQVKAVDDAYPLAGTVTLDPAIALDAALAHQDGLPGAVVERALAARLGLAPGDRYEIGGVPFRISALLVSEPDRASAGFGFGPRSLVSAEALHGTGLVAPGSLFETHYRLKVREEADLVSAEADMDARFPDSGLRWRDRRQAAPGIERFVERIGAFLVLVGLAALAVGGVGIAAAVRSYLEEKTETIAVLKSLGASGRMVGATYLAQIGALAVLGVGFGLALGAGLPLALGPLFADRLPVPALFDVYAAPLAEAGLYGLLTALVFALWPLARAREVRPAALFRDLVERVGRLPASNWVIATGVAGLALAGSATWLSGAPKLALGVIGGVAATLAVLWLSAALLRRMAASLARARWLRGWPVLRLSLAAIGGPGGDTAGAVLSLGLGLTTLAAIAQIDHNLRTTIAQELPDRAPAFFLIDIQNDQRAPILETLQAEPGVGTIQTAPMLRGIVTQLDGVPADEAEIDPEGAWILRGDRGVSYAAEPPAGTELLAGAWWPEDYAGPPLVSFSEEHARELRLDIGDTLTVSVLGREITAEIASLRRVDFSDMGINFLMIFDPGAFAGAPHTHIATVYAGAEAEGPVLASIGAAYPNVTAIGVREAIARVSDGLDQIASAARWAASAVLAVGVVVLIGAAAAGARRRAYEAAILKVIGAERARILGSFALRAALTGGAAGGAALIFSGVGAWAVITFVLEGQFVLEPTIAIAVVLGGALASLFAGLVFALPALGVRPARILRSRA
ncbi:MAG: FtsX-like permease family protein [Pseudomonadota bacterium]